MMLYKDDFGNYANILYGRGKAYKNGPLADEYTLILYAGYDNNKMYFLSIYETYEKALEKLKEFSCGTFKPE